MKSSRISKIIFRFLKENRQPQFTASFRNSDLLNKLSSSYLTEETLLFSVLEREFNKETSDAVFLKFLKDNELNFQKLVRRIFIDDLIIFLKKEGAYDKFVANVEKGFYTIDDYINDYIQMHHSSFIFSAFVWLNSKEGAIYWDNLCDKTMTFYNNWILEKL